MRSSRSIWTTVAVLALFWSAATLRGDQPQDEAKPDHRGRPVDNADLAADEQMSAMGRVAQLAATGRLDKALEKARGRRRGQIGAIHVAELLDAEFGEDDDQSGPAGGQAETSMAVDSTGQHIVVGFNDTRGFGLNPLSVSGFRYSDDGGVTFTDGGQLPVNTGTTTIGTTVFPQVFGDPEVKYLGGSTFVYFSIMVKAISATGTAQTMCVHRSTDNGHTWTGPFEIPAATNPGGLLTGANARAAADKELADVDPDSPRVMMSWTNFTGASPSTQISTTFSDDLLTATPPTWSTRVPLASPGGFGSQASIPRFAGNGSNAVYVAWQQTGSAGAFLVNRIAFSRSPDNGVTFGPTTASGAVTGTAVNNGFFKTMDYVLGNDRVHDFPSMAVDNSTAPTQGNVYVVYASNALNDGADIVFHSSVDGGATFSPTVRINSQPGTDRAQWFPWVTVDNVTGRVYVFYYDQRIPFGDITDVSVQHSDDGGVSWSQPMSLADRPFHGGHGNDTGQPNLGDYNQAVAQNGELFAVWAGTTQLGFTDGLPSGSMSTPDIFFKRLPAAASKVPLELLPQVTFTDGQNNQIDAGDLVSFTIPIANYVTNALNAAALTSLSATLSTTTPGVAVVQATRSYPDLAPGASAGNSSPFVVQLDQAFVPGAHIEFSLAVNTAQGSTTLLFTQATGTPGETTLLSENFDAVAPGALPAGWTTSHAGGANTVPWTTNNTFMTDAQHPASNAAFHANANDGTNPTRFERLFTPVMSVPSDAEYVTLDFDVMYDTEDDPSFNILAYDGFLLRVTDFGPTGGAPAVLRSVLAEAFAEEFTTGTAFHYPKHFPRNSSTAYFEDMSAWAGTSSGVKHVHMKLPGMAGRFFQLRWEFAQDSLGICSDVRPGEACGVAFDNLVIKSVVSSPVVTTSTTVGSSQNPSDSGQPVTFTATVTAGSPVADGTVTFREGATVLAGAAAVDASGQASFTTSSLSSGTHTITADYSGTAHFALSSGSVVQAVDALPTITINDVSVVEGNSGTTNAVFTVSLSASTNTATAQVSYQTADGTASSASDYGARSGVLSFAPGTTTRTVSVPVNGDNVIEPNETFTLNLSAAVDASIADNQGVGTIVNDDTVATTLGALVAQVGACDGGLNAGQCQALSTRLAAAQRDLAAGRTAAAVHGLEQFISEVQNFSHSIPGNGNPPRLDPAIAVVWIAEAQSIIASLTP